MSLLRVDVAHVADAVHAYRGRASWLLDGSLRRGELNVDRGRVPTGDSRKRQRQSCRDSEPLASSIAQQRWRRAEMLNHALIELPSRLILADLDLVHGPRGMLNDEDVVAGHGRRG
jgi:hypothetical protein